ncbi:MAG: alanine--glyoxylate aminotransferase family protein, partial [Pseudobdellovibrionaceae bacterium]
MTYSLLAPGPVNLHPDVLKIMSEPMIHHRTPLFDQIFQRVRQNLKPLFGTKQDVFLHSSTGSGGMESLLVNTLSP